MHRLTLAVCGAVLLCLMTLSHSAPLDCPDLVRALDVVDARRLEGRWAMIAGSLSLPPLMERLRRRNSATFSFSGNTSDPYIIFRRRARVGDKCHYSSYNITLEGNSFTHDNGSVTTTFIRTSCHDCILVSCDVESGRRQHFYLFSRRRQLEQKEVEEFRAQVECLHMPPPVVMDPTEELCPEEPAAEPTAQSPVEKESEEQKN